MSFVNGVEADVWIEENHPENGLFRVYWTEDGVGVSLEDTGYGLRYEWYYKDGKRADGISKGWFPNGQMKSIHPYKDGERDGLYTYWYRNGQKSYDYNYKNGKQDGLVTTWYENGQKKSEGTTKDGIKIGSWTGWYKNGQKKFERTYKDGIKGVKK